MLVSASAFLMSLWISFDPSRGELGLRCPQVWPRRCRDGAI